MACTRHVPRALRDMIPVRLLVASMLGVAPAATAQQQRDEAHPEGKWEVLDHCRLTSESALDGDSFRVIHKNREYIFRLYFVDTPETDPSLTERIQDQAAYFGISTNHVTEVGEEASDFIRERLGKREFTVITRWQNALGRSRLARFYCVVLVDGQNLAEELVSRGLARIYGLRANWPDGPRSTTFINHLKNLELGARERHLGAWNDALYGRADGADSGGTPAPTVERATLENPIDLNSASYQSLQTLKGIGPVLAERIIAHRPFKDVDDLERVPGIGPKTLEKLRPFVQVEPFGKK